MLSASKFFTRLVAPSLTRPASTKTGPRGISEILQKNPSDVVFTFAKRTAIGRAKKGQLKDTPVDELLQALLKVHIPTPFTCFGTNFLSSGISGADQT